MLETVLIHPLFGLGLTVTAYLAAAALWVRFGRPAIGHPVLAATLLVIAVLVVSGLPYDVFYSQAAILHQALGGVIVLLAVPLCRQARLIRDAWAPLGMTLVVGSAVAISTALALPLAAGADSALLATLAPKSATAAVAVEIAQGQGGAIGMTAVIVISTGIFGAVFGPSILGAAGVRDPRAVGFALGLASHAIGTARAFQISEITGSFASLGMILNAILTIALVPLFLSLLGS
ncbi:LrgB family protein [Halomonas sp. TRM85114]|uniref:LrgB family protein n=1 Tax=Halomonas jincaotanensis TaxID=2810616 RepID=UPI001BD575BD|nr:LrgB family protein [Halomonas jincaotanensis]MBS9405285.1 LrgB family protein [Halomonas jincaotanensis]